MFLDVTFIIPTGYVRKKRPQNVRAWVELYKSHTSNLYKYIKTNMIAVWTTVLKKVSWSKLNGIKSCTFSTDSVTVVIKVIYLHNAQTNVVHRDQEYNWKPPTMISRKQRLKEKGRIMLIKTVIKRCQDFLPPEYFERKLLNKKLGCRQKSLSKFPTAHNSCSLVRNLNRK